MADHSATGRRTITDDRSDDGSVARTTVRFGLDGVAYEIELSVQDAAALREALRPYVAAGRVVRHPRRRRR